MEVESWIASATKALARAGIKTARLDVLVLTENVINKDRSWLLAHPTDEITKFNVNKLNKLVIQRATHYPLLTLQISHIFTIMSSTLTTMYLS